MFGQVELEKEKILQHRYTLCHSYLFPQEPFGLVHRVFFFFKMFLSQNGYGAILAMEQNGYGAFNWKLVSVLKLEGVHQQVS